MSITITQAVATRMAAIATPIQEAVVDALVDKEVNRVVEVTQQGINLLDQKERELKGIDRPDIVAYDADGEETSANWSKQRLEQKAKLTKVIGKLTAAINKALEGDTTDLVPLLKNNG